MVFNHRFPDAVPALDTAGLVALISDPKKASELWARYEQARKEYEALRAAIAAESDKLDKKAAEVADKEAGFTSAFNDLIASKERFIREQDTWLAKRNAVEDQVAKREAEVADKAAVLEAKKAELDKRASEIDALYRSREKYFADLLTASRDQEDKLLAREAAVAVREKRADQLSKLLKEI